MADPFDLQRFLDAQAQVFDAVRAELLAGKKRTHWMWFIFPQISGLGSSAMSRRFSISSRREALAFLDHPILGGRLRDCTRLVNQVEGRSALQIFGDPDCMKFHSSMTLFAEVAGDEGMFQDALVKFFDGARDRVTLSKL